MRSAVLSWLAPLAATALACAVVGCANPERPPVISDDGWGPELRAGAAAGENDPVRPPAPRLAVTAEHARERWEHADALARLTPVGARGPSEHGGGGLEGAVSVNDAALRYANLQSGEPLPARALVVEALFEPGAGAPLSIYAMERLAGGGDRAAAGKKRRYPLELWQFVVVDAELRVAARGQLTPCMRCHADAPFGGLFGPGAHD